MTRVATATDPLTALRDRSSRMLDDLARLVSSESPSTSPDALARCGEVVGDVSADTIGTRPDVLEAEGHRHLRWSFGTPRVLLLGHYDTVWPVGTTERWPFTVADGRATGPGAFDMKAGVVQGFHALSLLDDLDGVGILLTSDEELGSPTSRHLIERTAADVEAVLVLEPSADGAVKVARKGVSLYEVEVEGRAAHAGLDPASGINALTELAHQVLAVGRLANPPEGTTVTPTVARAGTTTNTVPATARMSLDVRVTTAAEQRRVDEELLRIRPVTPGARLTVTGGPNRPPLQEEQASELYDDLRRAAATLDLPCPATARVGGASDGNFTAALGIPTLDGLGAVGDGAHAEGEHVLVDAVPERAALLAVLVDHLLTGAAPAP